MTHVLETIQTALDQLRKKKTEIVQYSLFNELTDIEMKRLEMIDLAIERGEKIIEEAKGA